MPDEGDFGGGEGVGLVDEVAELPFELEGFGGEGAGGLDGAIVFGPEVFDAGSRERVFLAADAFTSATRVSESSSVRAWSLLVGFSMVYSTRSQSSTARRI